MLSKCDGPECPKCGCTDSEIVRKTTQWGMPVTIVECTHCGKRFSAPIEEEPEQQDPAKRVVYRVMRCPQCNSKNTKVTSTQQPVRYHKCMDCGHNFSSIEV